LFRKIYNIFYIKNNCLLKKFKFLSKKPKDYKSMVVNGLSLIANENDQHDVEQHFDQLALTKI
jgi:hypothetical protein